MHSLKLRAPRSIHLQTKMIPVSWKVLDMRFLKRFTTGRPIPTANAYFGLTVQPARENPRSPEPRPHLSRKIDGLVSFFFKRGQRDRGDHSKLISTIAFNLTVSLRAMIRTVQDNLSEDRSIPSKAMGIQFNRLNLEPLLNVQLGDEVKRLIVVIDALDECGDGTHVPAMLRLLVQAKQAGNIQLRFFIASRPDFHPNEGFQKSQMIARS